GRVATPMALYPEYRETRTSFGIDVLGSVVVEVESESGVVGIGVSTGGLPAAFLVERHLARFVEGERADRIELMWDRMWRACLRSDCWMSLGPAYALRGAEALRRFGFKWIEEWLPPDDSWG